MKIYMVGYGTYEESEYTYLVHEETFTDEEFKQMIFNCIYDSIIEEKQKEYHSLHGYDDIHSQTVEAMIEKHGFTKLDIHSEWTCFGWPSMFVHGDWGGSREEKDPLSELVEFLNARGLSKADDDHLSRHEENLTSEEKTSVNGE